MTQVFYPSYFDMNYTRHDTQTVVTLQPAVPATSSIIWLHGLGADGNDFVPIVPELHLPKSLAVRFIFPHAPMRPITWNNGYVMRGWYDIKALALKAEEDAAGIHQSEQTIRQLIQLELDQGIAANRIVIAGFSQGGAMALQTTLRYPQRLAGLMALSTYLPLRNTLADEASVANKDIAILMCHGIQDPVVPFELGDHSRKLLQGQGYTVDFRTYNMPHSLCAEEVADISQWLQKVLTY